MLCKHCSASAQSYKATLSNIQAAVNKDNSIPAKYRDSEHLAQLRQVPSRRPFKPQPLHDSVTAGYDTVSLICSHLFISFLSSYDCSNDFGC